MNKDTIKQPSIYLQNLHYFFAQTDGTYKWPTGSVGDLLRQAKKEIEAATPSSATPDQPQAEGPTREAIEAAILKAFEYGKRDYWGCVRETITELFAAAPVQPARKPTEPEALVWVSQAQLDELQEYKSRPWPGIVPASTHKCVTGGMVIPLTRCATSSNTAVVEDLRMLVGKLVRALLKAAPDHALPAQAMDYLERKGLQGSPLRDTSSKEASAPCRYCDGTGDVHSLDGEWRGECKECDVHKEASDAAQDQGEAGDRLDAICDAYESGVGHGLKDDGLRNGYEYYSDKECAYAYVVGYEAGEERAAPSSLPVQEPVATVTEGTSFGPGLAFLANGKDFPRPGTLLYAAPAQPCRDTVLAICQCKATGKQACSGPAYCTALRTQPAQQTEPKGGEQ